MKVIIGPYANVPSLSKLTTQEPVEPYEEGVKVADIDLGANGEGKLWIKENDDKFNSISKNLHDSYNYAVASDMLNENGHSDKIVLEAPKKKQVQASNPKDDYESRDSKISSHL